MTLVTVYPGVHAAHIVAAAPYVHAAEVFQELGLQCLGGCQDCSPAVQGSCSFVYDGLAGAGWGGQGSEPFSRGGQPEDSFLLAWTPGREFLRKTKV